MLYCLLSSVLASANIQNSVTVFKSVAVLRDSFKPLLNIFSKHAAIKDGNLLVTNMNMTTTTPTIRLDNFPDSIEAIQCSSNPSEINVLFYDQELCQLAYLNWYNITSLAFLVGHEHNCNGNSEGTIIVSNMKIGDDNRSIVAQYETVERQDVVDDWDALITEEPIHHPLSGERTLKLDFDLNKYFRSIGQFIHLENCRSNGSVTFRMQLQGNRKTLVSYMLSMNGELNVTADVKIGLQPNEQVQIYRTNVLTIPFSPLSIPGVLLIGPAFKIDLALAGFSDTEITAGFGFNYHMPIDFEIASQNLRKIPTYKTKDTTKFYQHPLKFNVVDQPPTYVGGLVNTVPELVFGVTVLDESIGSIRATFNNELGMIHRLNSGTSCPEQPHSAEIFHRHSISASIQFWIIRKGWGLWDTGRKLLSATCAADIGKISTPAEAKFQNATQGLFQFILSDLKI